jgi:hypothetical protein
VSTEHIRYQNGEQMVKKEGLHKFYSSETHIFSDNDAKVIGPELIKIEENNNGLILPELVVEVAKESKSPLHKYFEWDNKKAATNWRKNQARQMISTIHVEIKSQGETKPKRVRLFYSVNTKGGRAYVRLGTVMKNVEYIQQIRDNLIHELHRTEDLLHVFTDEVIKIVK